MKRKFLPALIITLCLAMAIPIVPNLSILNSTGRITAAYANVNDKSLNDLVKYLKSKRVISGSATKMDASLIGAKSGVKFKYSGIELYEFNTSSSAYRTAVRTKKVTIEGFDIKYSVDGINGKFILICSGARNKSKVIKEFKAFE